MADGFLSRLFGGSKQDPPKKEESPEDVLERNLRFLKANQPNQLIPQRELPYFAQYIGWNIDSIQSAIALHNQGIFYESELLYRSMLCNARLHGALVNRAQAIRTLPRSLVIKEGTPNIIVKCIKSLEENFDFFISNNDQMDIQMRTLMFGFCICSVDKTLVDGYFIPRIIPFSNRYIQYDYTKLLYRVQVSDGNFIYIDPRNPGDQWVIFDLGGHQPWLKGIIRPLAQTFFRLAHAYDRWLNYNDFEASSKQVYTGPADQREWELFNSVRKIAELRGGDTAALPEGFDLKYLSSGGRGSAYYAFKDMISEANAEISILLLGNNLSQEVKGGSLAAAKESSGILRDHVIGDISNLVSPISMGPLKNHIHWNFNPALYTNLEDTLTSYSAKLHYDIDFDKTGDPIEMANAAKANADALQAYINTASSAGIDLNKLNINWTEMAVRCGIPLLDLANENK